VTNRGDWDYTYRGGVNGDGQLQEADHSGPGNWDFVYNTDGIGRRISVSNPASNGNLLANDDWEDPLNQFLSTQWTQQRVLRASLDREADIEITESHALPTLIPGLAPDPQAPPLRDIVFPLTAPGTQGGWTAWSITGTLEGGGDPGAAPDRKAKLAGLTWFPPAEETFTYDAAGNRSGSARWNYTYDGLNRLTRAVNKDLATAPEAYDVLFTYDAEGRRHSKTSKRYSNGSLKGETHTTWIWDGWHPVVERVLDAKSNKPIVERKLVWGPDLSGQPGGAGGAGGLLLIRETNHSFDGRPPVTTDLLPLYDGSGNIIGLANPAGELLAEYWYGPFGELLEATGPKADSNPWRWATKSLDKETGLVYFGLRYYDPTTGQWLSREPLGEGESLNLYAYCHNDPINRVDVLGAAEVKFSPALEGLHGNAEFQALFTVAWSGSQVTSGFPYAPSDWVFWRHKLGKLVNSVAEPFYEEWSDEDQIRRGREVSAVIADYETVFGEIIAGTRSAETAFHNRVRAQEAALKATPGYWVKTVAGDLRDAGQLATGFAMDTVTVPLGGARFRPWTHPLDQWQDVSGGERAFATAEFLLLPTAFLPTNASSRIISFGSHADDAARMSMAWGRRANNLMISSPGGGLRAIAAGAADLSPSQASVLAALPGYGASVIIPKRGFGLIDLSALSAKTGHEFAMFTTGGRRLLIRGNAATVPITPELGAIMARQGWRWSAHVHPDFVLRASQGDMDVLAPFFRSGRNNSSAILDPFGGRSRFSPAGDMVDSTWLPR
jgi:RHS repeat-associated protein